MRRVTVVASVAFPASPRYTTRLLPFFVALTLFSLHSSLFSKAPVSVFHSVTASGGECRFSHEGVLGASAPSGPVAPASASTSWTATATVTVAAAPLMVHGVVGVAAVLLLIAVAQRANAMVSAMSTVIGA